MGSKQHVGKRRAAVLSNWENLEPRRLLALTGFGNQLGAPQLTFDGIDSVRYDQPSGAYQAVASATSYFTSPDDEFEFAPYVALLEINLTIDNTGVVVSGSETPTDLKLAIDTNSSGDIDPADDLLLTGQIIPGSFAFEEAGTAEYIFDPTGGRWQLEFFTQRTIGVVLSHIGLDPFGFANSFSMLDVKGPLGSLVPVGGSASIGNFVWADTNANGLQDGGEAGIDGVTVELYDAANSLVATTLTSAGGQYLFDGLSPGDYHVKVSPPSGYFFTTQNVGGDDAIDSDSDTATGVMATTNLIAGEADLTWDAGLVTTGIDLEKFVKVLKPVCSGGEGLTPGYWKQPHHFDDWTGYSPNQSYNSVFGVNDPDGNSLTLLQALQRGGGGYKALGRHAVAALLNAAHANLAYAYSIPQVIGFVQSAYATGDFEMTKDRLAAENELEGDITSGGKGCTPDSDSGVGEDADDHPGVLANVGSSVKFTITVSNTGDTPLSNVVVIDDNGTPGVPGDDFNPAPILSGGFNVGDNDQDGLLDVDEVWVYAYTTPVTAGLHCNIAEVTSQPVLAGNNVGGPVQDSDQACYTAGSASIGNFVWKDTNANGVQNAGELGLAGVTVELFTSANVLVGTQATDANGLYLFSGLVPGSYYVKVTQPTGYVFSPKDQGVNDAVDSDANTSTGVMAVTTLTADEDDRTWDAGLFQLSSIGDFVWKDLNANGRQDSGEPGVGSVTVKLLNSGGGLLQQTTTDANGYYQFTGLAPASYMVEFVKPAGFNLTVANTGDDLGDSDANTSSGKTGTYVLLAGQQNLTVDAGLVGNMHGLTGTIGFWANNNGQTLIKLFNATSLSKAGTSTALGNWLAAQFPNVYGVKNTPNYFAGKTTAYIASRYVQIFNGTSPKTEAQFLALCFAIYTTTKELNSVTGTGLGQDFATKHGFILSNQSSASNLRNRTWNVGDNGEAFGTIVSKKLVTADNQSLTVWTILQRTNSFAVNGVLWASSQTVGTSTYAATTLQKQANVIFAALNEAGDILPWM